jgi:hypothetical protein
LFDSAINSSPRFLRPRPPVSAPGYRAPK